MCIYIYYTLYIIITTATIPPPILYDGCVMRHQNKIPTSFVPFIFGGLRFQRRKNINCFNDTNTHNQFIGSAGQSQIACCVSVFAVEIIKLSMIRTYTAHFWHTISHFPDEFSERIY